MEKLNIPLKMMIVLIVPTILDNDEGDANCIGQDGDVNDHTLSSICDFVLNT